MEQKLEKNIPGDKHGKYKLAASSSRIPAQVGSMWLEGRVGNMNSLLKKHQGNIIIILVYHNWLF